ncbi:MAG TPA: hypothetical protein VKA12_02980 [Roseiarcus sp.]|nr:hypothetical protein [Roseiarcus sp.]
MSADDALDLIDSAIAAGDPKELRRRAAALRKCFECRRPRNLAMRFLKIARAFELIADAIEAECAP